MKYKQAIVLGFNAFYYTYHFKPLPNATYEERMKFMSVKWNPHGRLLLALMQYLQQYTKYFGRINFVMTYEEDRIWPILGGLLKKINGSEIDVGVYPMRMGKYSAEIVDFAYPYKLEDYSFFTRKPVYKPHIFGIFQTFSLSVWITVLSVLFVMPIISYTILKRKYSFKNISFHVFAILMKQNSIIRPSSLVEKLVVYSWVVGAMILCFYHNSVILSFLSIPPLTKIKHLSDLALAVETGDYHCISSLHNGVVNYWNNSKQDHLKLIAKNIIKNKLSQGDPFTNFLRESHKQNLAIILQSVFRDVLGEKFIVSEDRFHESMFAMMVRKGFCCKELIDSFVHKIMASGLYLKYVSDGTFLASMELKSQIPDPETTNRKLTLTDVAPAFIFLLSGYFISFLVLMFEIWSGRNKMKSMKRNQKKKRRKVSDETHV